MDGTIPLSELKPGEWGQVDSLGHTGPLRRRLLDLGLTPGTRVGCVGRSPGGDPAAYRICQAVVAIRRTDAVHIRVRREERDRHGAD